MKEVLRKWMRPILFTAAGVLIGYGYYYFIGCSTGSCPITANPYTSMAYMGVIGWLMSGVFGKECGVCRVCEEEREEEEEE